MGIDKFYKGLNLTDILNCKTAITNNVIEKIITDYLFIDFNSIVYTTVSEIEEEISYILYSLILHSLGSDIDEKTKEYSTKWNFDLTNPTLELFKIHFSSKLIDETALQKIKEHIYTISSTKCVSENIKLIYIAFDGVPQMAKEIEQKKRRFNGYIISKIKSKIYEAHSNTLSMDRKIYEENKLCYDRGKIISWNPFMQSIQKLLTTEDFYNEIKLLCPNLKQITTSHQCVYGEGEKKIMEYIIENKHLMNPGKYTIFSPDSDSVILGIIAQNKLNNGSNVTVLRHNQQSKEYDSIDIGIVCDNMFKYVKHITQLTDNDINKLTISNDIANLFTLFGNDYIPKSEAIDVRNDIDTILDIYCLIIKKSPRKYLTYMSTIGEMRINYFNLTEFIKEIAKNEGTILTETYLTNKYKNYSYYKKELKTKQLLPIIEKYIIKANDLFNKLRTLKKNSNIYNIAEHIDKIIFYYKNDVEFMEQFLLFENVNFKLSNKCETEIFELFKINIKKILNNAINNNKEIKGNLYFKKYESFDINNKYHMKNITDNFIHPDMKVSDLDIEYYKFERRLDKYEKKLNADDFNLGAVKLMLDSDGNYIIKHYTKQEAIAKYYKTSFDINHEVTFIKTKFGTQKKIITFDEKMMTELVEDYLKALFWVFDNYFNKNNSHMNAKFVSTWIYTHHRSPLLYQIREILLKFAHCKSNDFITKMNSLFEEVTNNKKYIYERKDFMNKLEHYLYVTPLNRLEELPDKYDLFVKNNKELFPDLDEIANKIWLSDNNSDIIDCKRISFINKCNLTSIKFIKFNEFMDKIKILRGETETTEQIYPTTKYFQ